MKQNLIIYFLSAVTVAFVAGACDDDGEETMSWKPGANLHIVGPAEVAAGDEEQYYVDAFTIAETYTWELDGSTVTPERGGEFVTLSFPGAGTHTLSVTNGTYTGMLEITVEE
jgi:hypothetical protein